MRERSACRGCGTLPEEWDESKGGSRRAYKAVERQCLGCEQIQSKEASLPANRGHGMFVVLRRNEGV